MADTKTDTKKIKVSPRFGVAGSFITFRDVNCQVQVDRTIEVPVDATDDEIREVTGEPKPAPPMPEPLKDKAPDKPAVKPTV